MNSSLALARSHLTLVDLPKEIIGRILNIAFSYRISIAPLVLSCKELYYSYRHLLYMTKVIYVEEYKRLTKKSKNPDKLFLLVLLAKNLDLLKSIYVFNIHSNLSSALINDQNSRIKKFVPEHLPNFSKLMVLTVTLNSVELFINLLKSLPECLQVLIIRFEFTKTQLSLTNLKLLEKNEVKHSVTCCPDLKYLEIVSHNHDLTFGHLHPELARFKYGSIIPEEVSFQNNFKKSNMKLLNKIKRRTTEFKLKLKLSPIIYDFLVLNCTSLLKIEILGIDLNLIFNEVLLNQPPSINFPHLRMLSFDHTSRVNLSKWIVDFQLINNQKTFEGKFPLFLCHDKSSRRLYYKYSNVVRNHGDNNVMSEIELWEYNKDVCNKYLMFNKELKMEF